MYNIIFTYTVRIEYTSYCIVHIYYYIFPHNLFIVYLVSKLEVYTNTNYYVDNKNVE